jgi:transcriptional regulator with XRE-family HTH domain
MAQRVRGPFSDLAAYFEATGDTLESVAQAVKSTQATISRIRAGVQNPRPPLAQRLARYCHVPLDSFTRRYLATRQRDGRSGGNRLASSTTT